MGQDAPSLDEQARRFLFRRRIGEGAFGVVWEAYDTERGARVALKALTRTEPSSLYLFKREFRALADIVHPNLVTLYELLSFGEKWFFTMELVEGTDYVEHVRGMARPKLRSPGTETVTLLRSGPIPQEALPSERTPGTVDSGAGMRILPHAWYDQPTMASTMIESVEPVSVPVLVTPPEHGGAWNDERGRGALAQLAEGLAALHEAGKLHRDIKPSNVLVTGDGRVVILDFGLITELWPTGIHRDQHAIVGTPAFMSPEQSLGRSLTPASDWYAVGVMLYMTLTGKLPFDGAPLQVLVAKQRLEPPPPSSHGRMPADLEALCMDLLRREPQERPGGEDILRRLGGGISAARGRSIVPHAAPFVGREAHIAALAEGFAITKQGRPSAVILHGASGVGKSALAQAFVRALRRDEPDALVLAGRCFARESVPYKALDSVVDELSIYLQQLNAARISVLMPRGTDALLRIFPVLRQIESSAPQSLRPHAIISEIELRRRAFAALRELFRRIAERKQVVLILDDLQWSDADSDALLAELLRGPDAPPMLVIATFRTDDVEGTPLVRALRDESVDTRVLRVDPLGFEEARALALQHLGADEARAAAIARESGGNPFLVEALADHVGMLSGADDRSPESVVRVDLGDVFRDKIARLPKIARMLLETVAVAGHPIAIIAAWQASGVSLPEQSMLSLLMVRHLLRSRTNVSVAQEELEPYHERVREAALSGLSAAEIRERHERIALALDAAGQTDPEVLASHFEAAGQLGLAGRYALNAARQSAAALAFDRAARLYRWALALAPSPDDSATRERLGDALTNAGRGAEAAEAYLAAARGGSAHTIELRRKAAEQLLISGHVEEGLEVVRLVMASVGMRLPASGTRALVSFVASRARLKLRGLDFRERPASELSQDELLRIDACWAVAVGLSLVDSIRGADFQARHLMLALNAGEPYRVARALALEVVFVASGTPKSAARAAELVKRTLELAERIRHPHALGLALSMAGAAHYLGGRWRESRDLIERGAQILREECTGVTWERDTAEIFVCSALLQLGQWKELGVRYDEFLRGARARGDLYAETHMMLELGWYVDLARDAPWTARDNIERAFRRKTDDAFDLHDCLYATGMAGVELYLGNPRAALRVIEQALPRARRALMFELFLMRVYFRTVRAQARIACAAQSDVPLSAQEKLLRGAEADIEDIEREDHLYPRATATLLRASVASVRQRHDVALAMLERATHAYAAADMEVHGALVRLRLGELIGGAKGDEHIAEAHARLAAQAVHSPAKLGRLLAPGCWGR